MPEFVCDRSARNLGQEDKTPTKARLPEDYYKYRQVSFRSTEDRLLDTVTSDEAKLLEKAEKMVGKRLRKCDKACGGDRTGADLADIGKIECGQTNVAKGSVTRRPIKLRLDPLLAANKSRGLPWTS